MATRTGKKTTTAPTRRVPSAAELERAVEVMEAAKAAEERRKKKARWTSEGIPGKAWQVLAHPPEGGLRDLYRHVLTPWYWGVGAAGAIAAQEALVAANDLGGAASLGVVAAGALGTANAAPAWLRRQKAAERHPHAAEWAAAEPGHTRVVANAAGGGAVAAHALGLALGWSPDTAAAALAAGLVVFAASGARYWQYHRHHTVVANPEAAKKAKQQVAEASSGDAADPAELVRRLNELWPANVARGGKALPKATLTGIEQTSYGATALLHLVPGVQEKSTATAALGRIASGLKLAPEALAVEDVPPAPGAEPDSSVLRLRVVSKATRSKQVPLDDGRSRVVVKDGNVYVRLGVYIDGQGEAMWKLYDKDSMWGGFFAGKTGAGKTTFIETLVKGAFEHGATVVIYAKPRKGPSPRIAKHAHWVVEADPAERSALVDGMISLMQVRGLVNELNETSEFHPSPEWPGVMVVADEFHEFAAQVEKAGAGRLNRIAREGRAVGLVMVGASQGFGLEGFVQDDLIRSNMTATNAVSAKLAATQAGIFKREMGMSVNPGDLPDPQADDPQASGANKGLAYSLGGREIPFRGAWAPEAQADALMAEARTRAVPGLDARSAAALDKGARGAFSQRDERKERRKEEVRKMLEEMDAGGAAAAVADTAALAREEARRGGRPVPPALPERVVVDIRAHRAQAEKARRPAAEAGVVEVLTAQGPVGTSAVREALAGREGCGKEAVDKALKALSEEGVIAKAGESRKAPWKLV